MLVAAAAFLAIKDLEGDFGPSTGLQVLVFATYIQSVLTFYNAVVVCWMVSIAFQVGVFVVVGWLRLLPSPFICPL